MIKKVTKIKNLMQENTSVPVQKNPYNPNALIRAELRVNFCLLILEET